MKIRAAVCWEPKQALAIEDPGYQKSWIEQQHAGFNPPTT